MKLRYYNIQDLYFNVHIYKSLTFIYSFSFCTKKNMVNKKIFNISSAKYWLKENVNVI